MNALPIASVRLERVAVPSGQLYVPRYEVNCATWPYPAFLALSHIGCVLYMVIYVVLAARTAAETV